jgi:drug/metabolite transporter (DMT)-like permease
LANQGPLTLSIVTTTRKFFTIIISILYFGHPFNQMQMISLALVFIGIAFELYDNYTTKSKK